MIWEAVLKLASLPASFADTCAISKDPSPSSYPKGGRGGRGHHGAAGGGGSGGPGGSGKPPPAQTNWQPTEGQKDDVIVPTNFRDACLLVAKVHELSQRGDRVGAVRALGVPRLLQALLETSTVHPHESVVSVRVYLPSNAYLTNIAEDLDPLSSAEGHSYELSYLVVREPSFKLELLEALVGTVRARRYPRASPIEGEEESKNNEFPLTSDFTDEGS